MCCTKFVKIALAGTVLASCCSAALADTVLLRDGKTISGRVIGETPESVTIESSAGRFTFSKAQVVRVSRDTADDNDQREMEQYLAQGKIDAAMMVFRDSGLSQSMNDLALIDMFHRQLQNSASGAIATSGTLAELSSKFKTHLGATPEVLITLAAIATDHKDAQLAAELLRSAEQRSTRPFTWPVSTLMPLLDRIASAGIRLNSGTVVAGSAALAARLPQADSSKKNQLAIYAQIDEHIRSGDFLKASVLFHPDHFLHRADLFVPQAERLVNAILASQSPNIVIPAMESATKTILPYVDSELRLEAYKALVNRLCEVSRQEDAQRFADKVSASEPNSGAILEHLVEFRQRRTQLDPDSPVDVYKLASWAKSMGLLAEAKGLFLTLRSDPRFTETVNLQLDIIDHAQSSVVVRRLRVLYDRNKVEDMKREAAAFLQTSPPEQFAQEARDLLQLADFERWSQQRSSHGKAEAEFQHAERLAQRGEYDEALAHLNQIQMDREDTAAAQKAEGLRDKIMREKLRRSKAPTDGQTTPPGSVP